MTIMDQEAALKLTKSMCSDLQDDRTKLRLLDSYVSGNHPLEFATEKFLEAFGGMFKAAAINWCPLVISALVERLKIEGFQSSRGPNKRAWQIWQANNLDADSNIAHREASKYGRTYVMVGRDDDGSPLITVESALDVIHKQSSENRRKTAAVVRVFTADDGTYCATLYTPEQIFRWRRQGGSPSTVNDLKAASWVPRQLDGRDWPETNELGVVPIVPLLSSPGLDSWGTSDLAVVLPIQDMINKTVADMLVASEFVAMPQRYATGLDIERDPVTNQPINPFSPTSRLWQAEDESTAFGQFQNANLDSYQKTLEGFKQDIATATRTPPHYFYLSGQFPSGSSIKSAETGLVAKARDRMLTVGEGWEMVMRLALMVDGRNVKNLADLETVWADPEYHDEAALADSLIKKQSIGVPWSQLMKDAGYSEQLVESWQAKHDAEVKNKANVQVGGVAPVAPGTAPAHTDASYAPPLPAGTLPAAVVPAAAPQQV